MPTVWPVNDRRWLILDRAFAVVFGLLFAYNVANWQGFIGERSWQPLQSVFISGALLLQALAALVRRRSITASYVLLAASIVALVLTFVTR
jgi:hypothetical protein